MLRLASCFWIFGLSIFVLPGVGDSVRGPQWLWAAGGGLLLAAARLCVQGRELGRALARTVPESAFLGLGYLVIRSCFGDPARAFTVLGFLLAATFGVLSAAHAPMRPEKKSLVVVLAALTLLHALFGALQMLGLDPLFSPAIVQGLEPRLPAGFTGHHTLFGLLMALLAWFWLNERRVLPFLLCAGFVVASKSAFSLASLGSGMLWFAYCRGWRKSSLAAGLLAGITAFFFFLSSDAPGDFFFHNGRLPVWVYAFNAISEQPWLGYGIGEFSREFPAYHQVLQDKRWEEAHNELIEYVFNVGLIGVLAVLPFVVNVATRLWRMPMTPAKELAGGTLLMIGVNAMGSFPLQIAPFATLAIYSVAWILSSVSGETPRPNSA